MTQIFDHQTELATPKHALEVDFTLPQSGWVRVRVKPLHELYAISCSYIWDPFKRMIEWLEQIAGGCAAAAWHINQEGSCSRLQFYGGATSAGDCSDYLLHLRSNEDGIDRIRAVKVERFQMVESFYRGFRLMADDPAYSPREWDIHPQYRWVEDMEDEEYDRARQAHPYDGYWLRSLTSSAIESYLAKDAERQLHLFPRRGTQTG